jgi:hypothetical protein
VSVRVHSAVVAECERCGERSRPIDPDAVDGWQARHDDRHAREDRAAHWARHGHKVRAVTEWRDCDDSSGYAKCSCGWRSRSAKACAAPDFADSHLKDVEAGRPSWDRYGNARPNA